MTRTETHVRFSKHLKVWYKVTAGSDVLQRVENLSSVSPGLLEQGIFITYKFLSVIQNSYLFSKLIAGKAEDLEWKTRVLLSECIQRVVLLGEPSEGGQVHNKGHVTLEKARYCILH